MDLLLRCGRSGLLHLRQIDGIFKGRAHGSARPSSVRIIPLPSRTPSSIAGCRPAHTGRPRGVRPSHHSRRQGQGSSNAGAASGRSVSGTDRLDPCAPWGGLLASAGPRDHIVQLYQDQEFQSRCLSLRPAPAATSLTSKRPSECPMKVHEVSSSSRGRAEPGRRVGHPRNRSLISENATWDEPTGDSRGRRYIDECKRLVVAMRRGLPSRRPRVRRG
jgi:hypothetical protein